MPSDTPDSAPLRPEVALIWAEARGGVIGKDGEMPWHLREDMAHFRVLTASDTVVMGRRTWLSLPPRFRPLPGRRNIVVTRDATWHEDGAETFTDLSAALQAGKGTVWVIGGGDIYRQTMALADRLEVTEVDLDVDGDTVAPAIGPEWGVTDDGGWAESADGLRYRFLRYERVSSRS